MVDVEQFIFINVTLVLILAVLVLVALWLGDRPSADEREVDRAFESAKEEIDRVLRDYERGSEPMMQSPRGVMSTLAGFFFLVVLALVIGDVLKMYALYLIGGAVFVAVVWIIARVVIIRRSW